MNNAHAPLPSGNAAHYPALTGFMGYTQGPLLTRRDFSFMAGFGGSNE